MFVLRRHRSSWSDLRSTNRGEDGTKETALLYNPPLLSQGSLLYRERSQILLVTTQFGVLPCTQRNVSTKHVLRTLANAVDKLLVTLFHVLTLCFFSRFNTGRNRCVRTACNYRLFVHNEHAFSMMLGDAGGILVGLYGKLGQVCTLFCS